MHMWQEHDQVRETTGRSRLRTALDLVTVLLVAACLVVVIGGPEPLDDAAETFNSGASAAMTDRGEAGR